MRVEQFVEVPPDVGPTRHRLCPTCPEWANAGCPVQEPAMREQTQCLGVVARRSSSSRPEGMGPCEGLLNRGAPENATNGRRFFFLSSPHWIADTVWEVAMFRPSATRERLRSHMGRRVSVRAIPGPRQCPAGVDDGRMRSHDTKTLQNQAVVG